MAEGRREREAKGGRERDAKGGKEREMTDSETDSINFSVKC